jgi:Uma2 family endonuclease
MSAVLTERPVTFEAYMAWEAHQSDRHEFFAGEVFAMTGARATHNTIALNIAVALRDVLRNTSCRVFISDMKLHVASADASFYPDVFVSCDPRDRTPDAELVQRHPQLVVEVLSDSTAAFDRGQKFEAYRSLDSLKAYLLVEQNRPHADLFVRNAEGLWVLNPFGEGESLTIAPLGVVLPMEAIYEGITFNAQASPAVPDDLER